MKVFFDIFLPYTFLNPFSTLSKDDLMLLYLIYKWVRKLSMSG